jgi:acylpyruvate hydrolase
MRLAVFTEGGRRQLGVVAGNRIAPLGDPWSDLSQLFDAQGMARARAAAEALPVSAWRPADSVQLALPLARPGKVVCIGLNYRAHAAEGGFAVPDYPALFLRVATSLVAAGAPIRLPRVSEKLDYEAELLVMIGKGGRYIPEDRALDHVFGYSCFNDASIRDYQRKSQQWTPGKNFDATGAVGPVVVTTDELPPGASGLRIACRLNGQTLQDANTGDMIFSVANAVATISEFMTLEPGDMIATGTPQGVGHARKPPLWMKAGDSVEIEIEGIGVLRNPIEAEDVSLPEYAG